MDAHLQVIEGPDKGRAIPLAEGQVIRFGRGTVVDVQLSDPYASRAHCQIELKAGKVTVLDLGSSLGTTVNRVKIQAAQVLQAGDVILIGATKIQVFAAESAADMTLMPFAPSSPGSSTDTLPRIPKDARGLDGTVFASYQIGKLLAAGQSGVVYQATKPGEPPAALKVFHLEFSQDPEAKQRFLRAARTMRDLRHPHIVSVMDAGEFGPFSWLAMELVEGDSLAKVIKRIGIAGILDWRYGLRIAVHVSRGLEFAQKHSIIHRNIKPSNILVRSCDNFAKLGDLMLAKALQGEHAEAVTMHAATLADIDYTSPERVVGKAVDGRSDLFELGATIYAVLTGLPPFQGKSYAARTTEFLPPAPPKLIQLSIPDTFNDLVMRLLAREAAQRFQTPTELLNALEKIARDEKVIA